MTEEERLEEERLEKNSVYRALHDLERISRELVFDREEHRSAIILNVQFIHEHLNRLCSVIAENTINHVVKCLEQEGRLLKK